MTGGRMPDNKGNKRRFEEQDVQNLVRVAQKLQDDASKLPRLNHLEHQVLFFVVELANLEQRLRIARAELQAFEKNLASKLKEVAAAQKLVNEWQPKHAEQVAVLEKTRQTVSKFEKAVAQVEDKIFASFCQKHGFDNIRVYQAQQGSLEQEAAEKRSNFEVHKSKLQSTLRWETTRHSDTVRRVKQMQYQRGRRGAGGGAGRGGGAAGGGGGGRGRGGREALK